MVGQGGTKEHVEGMWKKMKQSTSFSWIEFRILPTQSKVINREQGERKMGETSSPLSNAVNSESNRGLLPTLCHLPSTFPLPPSPFPNPQIPNPKSYHLFNLFQEMKVPTLFALMATAVSAIYPDDHFEYSTKLTKDNYKSFISDALEAGDSVLVRTVASAG